MATKRQGAPASGARKSHIPTPATQTKTTAPPPESTTKPTAVDSKNAREYLEEQGILEKTTNITFDAITVALIDAASNHDLEEHALRSRTLALGYVAQQYTREFIAQQTMNHIIERYKQLQLDERKKMEEEVSEVRQKLEKDKSALADEMSRMIEEREIWRKAADNITSLKEAVEKAQGELEQRTKETLENVDRVANLLTNASVNTPSWPLAGTPGDPPITSGWGGYYGGSEGASYSGYGGPGPIQPRSYAAAAAAAATPSSTANGTNTSPDRRREAELIKLRGGEEKRDRQILLDTDLSSGGEDARNLTEEQLRERVDEAIQKLTAEDLLQVGEALIVKCEQVTKQPKGGALLLMNSSAAQVFLTQPDTCHQFTAALGLAVKVAPRRFKVVLEKVPIHTNIQNADLLRAIESDNKLPEGEVMSIKWIKDPARWTQHQRHAHALIEFRSKQTANNFIREAKMIDGAPIYGSKYITDASRCYKCQKTGHRQSVCPQPHETCGTCGGKHRTNTCEQIRSFFCVTCSRSGHATWDRRNCPNFFATTNSQSTHAIDRYYKFYLTEESWTWESATNEPRPTLPPNSVNSVSVAEKTRQGASKRAALTNRNRAGSAASAKTTTPHSRRSSQSNARPTTPDLRQTTLLEMQTPAYSPCRKDSDGPAQTTPLNQTTQPITSAPAIAAIEPPTNANASI